MLILAAHWRSLGKNRSRPAFKGTAEATKRTLSAAKWSPRGTGTLTANSSIRRRVRVAVAKPFALISESVRNNPVRSRAGLSSSLLERARV